MWQNFCTLQAFACSGNFRGGVREKTQKITKARKFIVIILLSAGKDTCRGDSGSPLMVKKDGRYTLVTINIEILEMKGTPGPDFSWSPFGPLDFVLCTLQVLRP